MIRGTIIFLVAVGLGALTVSGQDSNGEADLRSRIRALTNELRRRADTARPKARESGRPVMRIYEVGDLTMIVPQTLGKPVNLRASNFQEPEQDEDEPAPVVDMDWMIDVIRQLIEPQTWDMIEGADIQPKVGRLFINTIPRVHRKIEALLSTLRTLVDRQLRVELFAVPINGKDAAFLDSRIRDLSNAEAERLLARPSLGSAEIVCRSDQNVAQRIGRKVAYLQDYDVEIAQEAAIGDPIRHSLFSGMAAQLRAMLDDNGKGVRLDLQLARTHLREPIRRVDTEHGPLELPELALTRLRTSIWVPLDRYVILGGATAGDKACLFVGRVGRVGRKR